ncbi:Protein RUFY3 [Schistosoma japonicum]|uniref:Protein RUFY3 n=1 Tax=Schistosoma japonicum TaxID=6182 RepID=A0A4Z2CUV3_SCHJA|nr:Protein RUFY3 [Schistosoma japonicum]
MDVVRSSLHKITSKSLYRLAELVIKSQIESSVHRIPDESFADVQNFLAVLENLFYHGLRSNNILVGRKILKHPWSLILQLSNLPSFEHNSSIKLLDHLDNDFSKLRAWIKLSLVKCCLHSAMLDLVQRKSNLTNYYCQDAVFRSQEIFYIIDSLVGLQNIQFNLDFKSDVGGYSCCVSPIDFSPYLSFKQSLETRLSAICECQNENTSENKKMKCAWRRGFEKLKQNQVYYSEQQHYHEELIQKQSISLDKYKEQLNYYKEATANLQSYILELQVKLTLIHEQYDQELKRLGVKHSQLTAPTFRNIPNRINRVQDINKQQSSRNPSQSLSYLSLKPIFNNNAYVGASTSCHQMPSILSVDQGIDALSLEDSSVSDISNCHLSSTPIAENVVPGELKRRRLVKFIESDVNNNSDQDLTKKHHLKRLSLPIKARSASPSSNSSSFLSSSMNESSQSKNTVELKSLIKSNNSGQPFNQKSKMLVSVQEIPSERFILPDTSHSNTSSLHNSPKTLDSMTVIVKPRSHSLFSYYVPKISTDEVKGIIRHVDSLMNPHSTTIPVTTTTVTTAAETDTATRTSMINVDNEDDITIDDSIGSKNQCSNLFLSGADLMDSITSSEIMETSSEYYNSHDRLQSSTREFYHLTSEEDLGSSDGDIDHDIDNEIQQQYQEQITTTKHTNPSSTSVRKCLLLLLLLRR